MSATPCYLTTDPEEKSAWLELVAAEDTLDAVLRKTKGSSAEIDGSGYFIDDVHGLLSGPIHLDGNINKRHSMHREDLEGLSADDLRYLSRGILQWLKANPEA